MKTVKRSLVAKGYKKERGGGKVRWGLRDFQDSEIVFYDNTGYTAKIRHIC